MTNTDCGAGSTQGTSLPVPTRLPAGPPVSMGKQRPALKARLCHSGHLTSLGLSHHPVPVSLGCYKAWHIHGEPMLNAAGTRPPEVTAERDPEFPSYADGPAGSQAGKAPDPGPRPLLCPRPMDQDISSGLEPHLDTPAGMSREVDWQVAQACLGPLLADSHLGGV